MPTALTGSQFNHHLFDGRMCRLLWADEWRGFGQLRWGCAHSWSLGERSIFGLIFYLNSTRFLRIQERVSWHGLNYGLVYNQRFYYQTKNIWTAFRERRVSSLSGRNRLQKQTATDPKPWKKHKTIINFWFVKE